MTKPAHDDIPCDEVIRAVWDYLDGEIDAERKERIRRHLETCDHCRGQYTFEGAFLRAAGRLLDGDVDTTSLRARIERELLNHGFGRTT